MGCLVTSAKKLAKISFTNEDKKAFYTALEQLPSGCVNRLGCCFKMMTYKDEHPVEVVWVSTPGILYRGSKTLIARNCKDNKDHQLGPEVVSKHGVGFIGTSDEEAKNYLKFGCWDEFPEEISAYVYDKSNILELKFHKTSINTSTNEYELDSSTCSKASSEFELRKAVGSPVIVPVDEPNRNQVVGILDAKTDGSLYPVFFYEDTFDLDKSPTESPNNDDHLFEKTNGTQRSGSPTTVALKDTESEEHAKIINNTDKDSSTIRTAPESEDYDIKKTNGTDKSDSPIVTSATASTSVEEHVKNTNGDKTDSLMVSEAVAVSEDHGKKTNGDKTDSPVVVSDISKNNESNERIHQQEQEQKPTFVSNVTSSIFQTECIKKKTLAQTPQTANLFMELQILLDPQRPLGGDYRSLADEFRYNSAKIHFLKTKPSPTDAILTQEMYTCTFEMLRTKLTNIGRDDAVDEINKYVKNQGCNCEQCGDIR